MATVGRKRIFTDEVLESIPRWVDEGLSRDEIAQKIGTTVSSLVTCCSQYQISLKHMPPVPMGVEVPYRTAKVWMRKARSLGLTTDELIKRVLVVVAKDDLFKAVIDE